MESESDADVDEKVAWDIEGEDVQESQTEETDWAPHEDSAPSTDEYTSQSEEELDGIDSSNTVRYM